MIEYNKHRLPEGHFRDPKREEDYEDVIGALKTVRDWKIFYSKLSADLLKR
jgi:hypothetical protein